MVVVITLVATTLIGLTQPQTYVATTTVLVGRILDATPDYNEVLRAQRLAPTYAELVTTRPMAEAVVRTLDPGRDPTELLASVSATAATDSLLIHITVRDTDPTVAAAVANAFAAQLVMLTTPPSPLTTTSPVTIVEEAVVPTVPDQQPTIMVWLVGAASALLLGLAVVLLLALRDARARRLQDVPGLAA
jgi:capsular polysaccharide biosynthesis protein